MKIVYNFTILLLALVSCSSDTENKKEYYEDGVLALEAVFQDGKKNGLAKRYFPTGQLEYEGVYENDLRTGWHTLYYPNGKVSQRILHQIQDKKEKWVQKIKYDENGNLISDLRFAKKNLKITPAIEGKYHEGDTLSFVVRIENPKYPYVKGTIGFFDENLNPKKYPRGGVHYVNGNLDHEVSFKIYLGPNTPDTITGLIRDYTYHPTSDSTGWSEGEDSFLGIPIFFEKQR